ncbi:MAG: sigma 54-interacting transcriptional regulator [Polyangiaceae bacterium]|jgi:DNA-binding NtrC family response regulator|nr:sigma 54-interacting transcriptional regulator [Polyangiaceae bacterium]MBK8936138.1 sigma 54-interacting transcriptional regulator [Polyangiaceae bacterium]
MPTRELPASPSTLGDLLVRVIGPPTGPSALLRPGCCVVVGSSRDADLRVEEPTVSGRHVRLEHKRGFVLAADLGSKNGTTLFGQRVALAEVRPGVRLGVGAAAVEVLDRRADPSARSELLRGLAGRSPPMVSLADRVQRIARLVEPALIRGESGTGKELVARALHDLGPRNKGPFVAINAASLSRELAESELFGHRRGAFTGAVSDRRGAFREADGGTLFIDEVAQLGLEVQGKLLRVVEERKVRPLGGDGPVGVDVRLVAATCEPLEEQVVDRRFRADLFQRIAVCVVRVPPLRDRLDDLPLLAPRLLCGLGLPPTTLLPGALAALGRGLYRDGNVRELRSVLLAAAIDAGAGTPIAEEHVLCALSERGVLTEATSPARARAMLASCGGNRSAAARRLGLPRSTFRDLLERARQADPVEPPIDSERPDHRDALYL